MLSENIYQKLSDSIQRRKDVALVMITEHPNQELIGTRLLLWPNGNMYVDTAHDLHFTSMLKEKCLNLLLQQKTKTIQFEWNKRMIECYVEVFAAPAQLIVAGAGHVCEPVTKIGKMVGFDVTVIDDRQEFANRDRFPDVDEVICEPFLKFFRRVPVTSRTYILLLTRGHQFDVMSLQELLERKEKAAYIGMIGSRRRIAGVFELLKEDFPDESFENIYTPVGLDIGAETPEEIAVSIIAEMLKVKNKKSGKHLSDTIRQHALKGFK